MANVGRLELLAGSDDFAIRAFKEEEVINEVTEADKVVGLAHMAGNKVRRSEGTMESCIAGDNGIVCRRG